MSLLQPLVPRIERTVLALDRFLSRALHSRRARGSLSLLHYCGWGTPGAAELSGRVVLPRTVKPPKNADPRWRNFVNILRRLLSREIGGVEVLGEFQGVQARAVSDSDGFFTLRFEAPRAAEAQAPAVVPAPPMPQALSQDIRPGADAQPVAEVVVPPGPAPVPLKTPSPFVSGWQRAELRLGGRERLVQAQVRVVDDASCAYGLISDLDDTVIRSDVTSVARMLYTVLTGNARTRAPFPGVGSLYRALARHGSEPGRKRRNPVFYVSSSPW
ncbi:MAG: phosphatase domain-containing protein, partial [Deinococcus sp.]